MKGFFNNHPFIATFLTSCFVFMLFIGSGAALFIMIIGKSISTLNKDLAGKYENKSAIDYQYIYGNSESSNKFLSIPVTGVILSDENLGDPLSLLFPNFSYGYKIKQTLVEAAKDTSIKGIIIEMDSPGGTISGANAISDGILKYKETTGNPVYVHISNLAASGGYWAAAVSDQIIADRGALTGSIGVIMGPFKEYNDVMAESDFSKSITTLGGIESTNIIAGEDKDFGDPYKTLSPKAKQKLQEAVNYEYNIFVDHVSKYRSIDKEKIVDEIGAYVYSNDQALELGLIDSESSKDGAYMLLAEQVNVGTDFQIVGYKQLSLIDTLFGVLLPISNKQQQMTCRLCNQMLYLHGNPSNYGIF